MFANNNTVDSDPFTSYARALHDYTLRLWTESIQTEEEKGREQHLSKRAAMTKEEGRAHKKASKPTVHAC